MRIEDLVREAHRIATEKGWWRDQEEAARAELESAETGDLLRRCGAIHDDVPSRPGLRIGVDAVAGKLALIAGEAVGEALECVRDLDFAARYAALTGKPEGFAAELADVIIRACDLAGAMGIDLQEVIVRKMAYNSGRPYRHGGRAA